MELKEIIEKIDCVKSCISKAFETGTLDLDAIVSELEALKPALAQVGERFNSASQDPSVSAMCQATKPNQVRPVIINAEDFR